MQVILTQNVPRVGNHLDVVKVSNGYANNFLFPQGLAEPATPAKIAELEKRREVIKAQEEASMQVIKEKLEGISEATVTITVKTDEQGHLYKKLHADDIVEALKSNLNLELDETAVLLDSPIHEVGDHEVAIEAAGEKTTVTITVEKEE